MSLIRINNTPQPTISTIVSVKDLRFEKPSHASTAHSIFRYYKGKLPYHVQKKKSNGRNKIVLCCAKCNKGKAIASKKKGETFLTFSIDEECSTTCASIIPSASSIPNLSNTMDTIPLPEHNSIINTDSWENAHHHLNVLRIRNSKFPYKSCKNTGNISCYSCPDPSCVGSIILKGTHKTTSSRKTAYGGPFVVLRCNPCHPTACWANIHFYPRQKAIHKLTLDFTDGHPLKSDFVKKKDKFKRIKVQDLVNNSPELLCVIPRQSDYSTHCICCFDSDVEFGEPFGCRGKQHFICSPCYIRHIEGLPESWEYLPQQVPIWLPLQQQYLCPVCQVPSPGLCFRNSLIPYVTPCGFLGDKVYFDEDEFRVLSLQYKTTPIRVDFMPGNNSFPYLHYRTTGFWDADTGTNNIPSTFPSPPGHPIAGPRARHHTAPPQQRRRRYRSQALPPVLPPPPLRQTGSTNRRTTRAMSTSNAAAQEPSSVVDLIDTESDTDSAGSNSD